MLRLFRRLRARLRYRHFDDDLAREIESHRAMAQASLEASGASKTDATHEAMRRMGNVTLAREQSREQWLAPWLDGVRQDLRYAARTLRRSPGFAAMATAALVLAIGLNTSLFTTFNAIALKPWPVADPERVVIAFPQLGGQSTGGVSPVEYRMLRDEARSVRLVGFSNRRVQFGSDTEDDAAPARLVTGNYFDVLGIRLALGRGFLPEEDLPGNPRAVMVLGDPAWHQRFGADPGIVGRTITINGAGFTVVGVAAPGATDSPLEARRPWAWVPVAALPLLEPNDRFARDFATNPGHCCVRLAGRLADGADRATAASELTTLDRQFELSRNHTEPSRVIVSDTTLLTQPDAARVVPVFALLFAGVLLLLLLACANVGNLQLARAMSRRREIGIRIALGASRRRVIRQLLAEGLVLAIGAGALSMLVGSLLPIVILSRLPGGQDAASLPLAPDLRVLAFTGTVSVLACLLFGLAPALRGTRATTAVVRGGRSQSDDGRLPLRTALLATQVGLSAVLLVAAGLLVRAVLHASSFDPGFRTEDVIAATIQLPRNTYTPEASHALLLNLQRALDGAGAGPVGAAGVLPLSGTTMSTRVQLPGEPDPAARTVEFLPVSPGFFPVLDLTFVAGRPFTPADGADALVVNETLARALWPAGDAVGRTFVVGSSSRQVIGVVKDAHLQSLDRVAPTLFQQERATTPQFLARDAAGLRERIRAIVAGLDDRAVVTIRPLSDNLRESLRNSMVAAGIAAGLGLSGLALATIGVFGVFSYMVTERTREIGIRLAIGARAGDVVRVVLGSTAWSLGAGLAVGLGVSLVASPVLRSALYGVSPRDPAAMGAAAAALTLAALAATVVPVWRALRVDPAATLRQD